MVGILKSQWQMSHPNKTTHRLYQPSTMTKPWWTGKPIHALQLTSCKPNHLAEVSGTILIKLAQKSGSPAFICKQAFLIWWTNSALRMLFFFEYIHSTLGLPLQSCPEVLLETQVYYQRKLLGRNHPDSPACPLFPVQVWAGFECVQTDLPLIPASPPHVSLS